MDECLHEHELLCDGSEHICRTCGVWIEHCELEGTWPTEVLGDNLEAGENKF